MNKKIVFIVLFLLSVNLFAEPLLGYSGIKFGTQREIVTEELKKQGWRSFYSSEEDKDCYVGLDNEKLNLEGIKIQKIDVTFFNNKFFDIRFYFYPTITSDDFKNVIEKLDEKYGLTLWKENDDAYFFETDNGNIVMITIGTQRSLISDDVQRIYVIEMFDREIQREYYNYNFR